MQFRHVLAVASLLAPALAIGRECCCDRYSQFNFDTANDIVAQCKQTWANVNSGASDEDYCNSVYCVQQQEWWNAGAISKCAIAGYQCGDCANGNVGCLG